MRKKVETQKIKNKNPRILIAHQPTILCTLIGNKLKKKGHTFFYFQIKGHKTKFKIGFLTPTSLLEKFLAKINFPVKLNEMVTFIWDARTNGKSKLNFASSVGNTVHVNFSRIPQC